MSWNKPRTWADVTDSAARGLEFTSRPLGVASYRLAVCGNVRQLLSGHLDDFAHEILDSNDALHRDYMATSRGEINSGTTDYVLFVVARDGNALAYVTRNGNLKLNPSTATAGRRYIDAIARITYPLARYATKIRLDGPESF